MKYQFEVESEKEINRCGDCKYYSNVFNQCLLSFKYVSMYFTDIKKPEWCPLVEVKEVK